MEDVFHKAKLEQKIQFDEDVKLHVECLSSKILEKSDTCRTALENYYLKTGFFPHYTYLSECVFQSGKIPYKNGRDPFSISGFSGTEGHSESFNNIVRQKIAEKHPHVTVNGFNEPTIHSVRDWRLFWSKGKYFNYNITIKNEHYPHLNKN